MAGAEQGPSSLELLSALAEQRTRLSYIPEKSVGRDEPSAPERVKVAYAVPMDLPSGVSGFGSAVWSAAVQKVRELPQGRVSAQVVEHPSPMAIQTEVQGGQHAGEAFTSPPLGDLAGGVQVATEVTCAPPASGVQEAYVQAGLRPAFSNNFQTPFEPGAPVACVAPQMSSQICDGRSTSRRPGRRPSPQASHGWMAELRHVHISSDPIRAPPCREVRPAAPRSVPIIGESHWLHMPARTCMGATSPPGKLSGMHGAIRRRRAIPSARQFSTAGDQYESGSDDSYDRVSHTQQQRRVVIAHRAFVPQVRVPPQCETPASPFPNMVPLFARAPLVHRNEGGTVFYDVGRGP